MLLASARELLERFVRGLPEDETMKRLKDTPWYILHRLEQDIASVETLKLELSETKEMAQDAELGLDELIWELHHTQVKNPKLIAKLINLRGRLTKINVLLIKLCGAL